MLFIYVWEILLLFFACPLWSASHQEMLQEASQSYQQGENASTFEQRQKDFNQALWLYHMIEQENDFQDASLEHALGDTYFQLEEYAWAILHYQRSLKQQSDYPLVLSHLEKAQHKLGLSVISHQRFFYSSFLIPSAKQFEWLFWAIVLTFLTCSCLVWFPSSRSRKIAMSCVCVMLLLLGHLLFMYYFTPIEGILVTSTGFYRAPDENQPQLTSYPLFAGSKVRVLQSTEEGEWLKISNSEGLIGYIPTTYLRLI